MVPLSWKGKDVFLELVSQEDAGAARLEDITDTGVVLARSEDGNETLVFFPWHVIIAIELTDSGGPAGPGGRRPGT